MTGIGYWEKTGLLHLGFHVYRDRNAYRIEDRLGGWLASLLLHNALFRQKNGTASWFASGIWRFIPSVALRNKPQGYLPEFFQPSSESSTAIRYGFWTWRGPTVILLDSGHNPLTEMWGAKQQRLAGWLNVPGVNVFEKDEHLELFADFEGTRGLGEFENGRSLYWSCIGPADFNWKPRDSGFRKLFCKPEVSPAVRQFVNRTYR